MPESPTSKVLKSTDPAAWEKVLEELPATLRDVHFSSRYLRMYELNGDGEARLFTYRQNDRLFVHAFLLKEIPEVIDGCIWLIEHTDLALRIAEQHVVLAEHAQAERLAAGFKSIRRRSWHPVVLAQHLSEWGIALDPGVAEVILRDAGAEAGGSEGLSGALPLLSPIIAVVMTFSVLFTFTDFQLIWALTRGGPVNATHLMATLSYQRGILSGRLGEGAAIATAMIPFLVAATLSSYFGLQRRKWQQGERDD